MLFTLVSVGATAAISVELPKEYESTAVDLVNPKQVLLPGADTGYSTQLDQLVETYVELISNQPVWDQLIADHGGEKVGATPATRERLLDAPGRPNSDPFPRDRRRPMSGREQG